MVVFTIRLREELAENLESLANATQRSRAGVIRWLIQQAAIEKNQKLQPPSILNDDLEISNMTIGFDHTHKESKP
jgi:metal-responsive CopG/Arc/MetJ family transcriptional regulator